MIREQAAGGDRPEALSAATLSRAGGVVQVAAHGLEPCVFGREGSNPSRRTHGE
jgi:hypothetical protein